MISQQLLDYIKSQLQNGVEAEKIKEALRQSGWEEKDIQEGFQMVGLSQAGTDEKNIENLEKLENSKISIDNQEPELTETPGTPEISKSLGLNNQELIDDQKNQSLPNNVQNPQDSQDENRDQSPNELSSDSRQEVTGAQLTGVSEKKKLPSAWKIKISPYITFTTGIILIIIARTILKTQITISQFTQFFGFILFVIGSAGLLEKLFRIKEISVSKFKYSRHIAYALSSIMIVLIILNWQNLPPIFWPVLILFCFALIFNGGIGGKTIFERLPFYLSLIGLALFLVLAFLSM